MKKNFKNWKKASRIAGEYEDQLLCLEDSSYRGFLQEQKEFWDKESALQTDALLRRLPYANGNS